MNSKGGGRGRKHRDECLLRVPYASIMAALLCGVGVVLFSVMMVWAFNASVEQARRALDTDSLPWLQKVQVFFIVVAVLMGIATSILLAIGAMSTGSTRDELYSGVKGQLGGRMANSFAMVSAYVLNICWLLCFACTAVLCFIYYLFNSLCSSVTAFTESNCLDFGVFRPLFEQFSSSSLRLCGGDLQQFCALSSSAFIWYVVGLVGTFLTIKGLVHFLICCSANYAHVTSGTKYADLRELLASEDIDAGFSEIRGFGSEGPPRPGSRWARPYSSYRR